MVEKRLILAHDLGTTGNKASLFDRDGSLLGSAFHAYPTAYPRPNWAEQDPQEWWQALCQTTQRLLAEAGAKPEAVAAVSFSGHMMGCLPVDQAGHPLRSCIIWADQRAQDEAHHMAALLGADTIYQVTGHRVSPAYTGAKILWIRHHQPEIFQATATFLQPKDYLAFRLTGQRATDYSDASGTLLFDLEERYWNEAWLAQLEIPPDTLPPLYPSTAIIGHVTPEAAQATGLAEGTPVVIGGGDGACAGVGAGVVEPGAAYAYIGSSAWISVSTPRPILDPQQRTFTFHHLHPERYCPMGTMQAAGGARDWAWQRLAGESDQLDRLAAQAPVGADGVLFLPHLLGERSPFWNPQARGAFVGLTMGHGEAEMARAVLEGVAFNLRLIFDALRPQLPHVSALRLIGGGSRSGLWCQILANCLNLPVQTLSLKSEATSWGAAVAGGVAVGLFDWSMAAAHSQVVETFHPQPEAVPLYDELVQIYTDAYRALAPIHTRLAAFQKDRPE
ncbi:MAG: xylulokinase [Litorilinea sp.]|nr:MAG: xylulokinase [Litorilinea sp.]